MSNYKRGRALARAIFNAGDESHDKVHRIEFKGGSYPNKETNLGGLGEGALAELLIAELNRLDAEGKTEGAEMKSIKNFRGELESKMQLVLSQEANFGAGTWTFDTRTTSINATSGEYLVIRKNQWCDFWDNVEAET